MPGRYMEKCRLQEKFLFSISITGNSLLINKHEGVYDFQPNNIFGGGSFRRVIGAEHEIEHSGSVNMKVLYLF